MDWVSGPDRLVSAQDWEVPSPPPAEPRRSLPGLFGKACRWNRGEGSSGPAFEGPVRPELPPPVWKLRRGRFKSAPVLRASDSSSS